MITWITNLLSATITNGAPLMLCTLGVLFCERAGVMNIALEGLMLVGSFFGVYVTYVTNSLLLGVLCAMLAAMLLNLLQAVFVIRLHSNQVVTGLAINIMAGGLTILLNRRLFGLVTNIKIPTFEAIRIPVLADLPVVGVIFNQPILVYIGFILVPVFAWVLKRTNVGLKLRSVGENPQACDTVGINVARVRYGAMAFSGLFAGLGGAFISMYMMSSFTEGMVSGRGYMAMAAIIFGNYTYGGTFAATMIFGCAYALQYRLQLIFTEVPIQFFSMFPFIVTIVALCIFGRKSKRPASSGIPYVRR